MVLRIELAKLQYKFVLNLIIRCLPFLGTPNEKIWPGYNKLPAPQKMKFIEYPYATLRQKFPVNMLTESGMDLMKRFLTYDPKQRITCDEVRIVLSFISKSDIFFVYFLLGIRR